MPVLPPVTMATLPLSVMVLLSGGVGGSAIRPPPSESAASRILPADLVDTRDGGDGIIGDMAAPVVIQATASLRERDPVLAGLIDRHGPPPPRRRVPAVRRFANLAEMIVYQQLAGKAAASIHGRFVVALGGSVRPEAVLAAPPELLSSCGLSGAKSASIRDLADKVMSGEVELDRIGRLSDDQVVEHLTRVRGIGPWTAQMFLMSTLGRLDVWPVGDFGVRAG